MDIREIIDRIYRMPESSAVRLTACMSSLSRPRGYCVLEAGVWNRTSSSSAGDRTRLYFRRREKGHLLDRGRGIGARLPEKLR